MKNKVIIYQVFSFFLLLIAVVLLIDRKPDSVDTIKSSGSQVMEVILNRRSVRNYIPDREISQENIETILKAGMAAPSGRDLRPWEILVINDREILTFLAEKLPYAKMLSHAPLAMIVCGNKDQSFYWYLDCSAVTQNILLAVEALGLGAVWTAAYPYEDRISAVREVIDLPENVVPLNVIPVGYPEGEHHPKNKYDSSKVHINEW